MQTFCLLHMLACEIYSKYTRLSPLSLQPFKMEILVISQLLLMIKWQQLSVPWNTHQEFLERTLGIFTYTEYFCAFVFFFVHGL